MALRDIIDKIAAEAKAKTEELESSMARELKAIDEKSASDKAAAAGKIAGDTAARIKREKEKLSVLANIEISKKKLAVRKELLEESFSRAFGRIASASPAEKKKFLGRLVAGAIETGQEEIVLPKGELKRLGAKFAEGASEEASKRLGRKVKLKVTEGSIKDGFILRQGKKEKNYTLEMIFRQVREDLETEISRILTG